MKQQAQRLFICLSLFGGLASAGTARAEVTGFKVTYTAPGGKFGANEYVLVEAMISGTVTRVRGTGTGNYSIPATMMYPVAGGNGFGFVDLPNTSFFENYPRADSCNRTYCPNFSYDECCETRDDFLCEKPGSVPMSDNQYKLRIVTTGRDMTENYLFTEGYTYIAVNPSRAVMEFFGPEPRSGDRNRLAYGTIESGEDGMLAIIDVGNWLRNPSDTWDANGFDVTAPAGARKVIGFGYSQTASVINSLLKDGSNFNANGSLAYDGFLPLSGGALCEYFIDTNPPTYFEYQFCVEAASSTGDAKVVAVNTESDVEFQYAGLVRADFTVDPNDPDCAAGPAPNCSPNPNYIAYELPGVAHIPGAVYDMAELMQANAQNPVSPRPFVRAAIGHLHQWIEMDVRPPDPIPIGGTFDADFNFTFEVDADGNKVGGIRLPHMPSTLASGPAGAPLGVYGGIDYNFIDSFDPATGVIVWHVFATLAGTFVPFTPEQLNTRYPTAETYRALVTAAAEDLYAKNFILQEDRDEYVAGVKEPPPFMVPPDPTPRTPPKSGGCSTTTPSGLGSMLAFLGLALLVSRRKSRK